MAVPFIQNSFASGELAPTMWGRTDLARYKSGLAVCRNFFVDYRGGVSSRAGTSFVGIGPAQSGPIRLLPFIFSSTQAYVLEFTDSLIRFIYQGAYVTETPLAISTVSYAYPAVFTVPGSGFAQGQQVYISDVIGLDRANGISGVNGRTLIVDGVSGDSFSLYDPLVGYIDSTQLTPYLAGGTVAALYSIASPYAGADLANLKFTQSADVLDIAHVNYQPAQLRRLGAANWQLVTISFGANILPPGGLIFQSVGGPAGSDPVLRFNYCVTAISQKTGEESVASAYFGGPNNALDQDTGIANYLSWDPVVGAIGYKVYATLPVLNGSQGPAPYFVGYIGTTTTPNFHDVNIEPDYSTVPPLGENPFALGPITSTLLEYAGFGYIEPTVVITDPTGSGAVITATADTAGAGEITGLTVSNGGTNYSSPVLSIQDNSAKGHGLVLAFSGDWDNVGGSSWSPANGSITISNGGTHYHAPTIALDAAIIDNVTDFQGGTMVGHTTASVVTSLDTIQNIVINTSDGLSPPESALVLTNIYDNISAGQAIAIATVDGLNNPGVVTYFDQRKVFAGSTQNPDTFWASRVGLYNNFDTSFPSQAADALTESIVSSEVNIIQSLTPMAGGLIALTTSGAYQISGGTPGAPLTPTTITSQAQAFSGANSLQPVRVNYDLIYAQARGSAVRDLTYNFYLNVYTGQDISAQSQHLFYGRTIVQWAYAEEPFKIIWGVRDDGILLGLTIMKEQEIMGWTRHDTAGKFIGVTVIPEGNEDVAYFAVSRWFNGQFYNVVERQASRQYGGNPAANIPSNPEQAWCLDCASVLPPTPAVYDIIYGRPYTQGSLATATVMEGGSGYSEVPFCQVLDGTEQGYGGTVALTVAGGQVTSAAITNVGEDYDQPYLLIKDPTGVGQGAIVSLSTENLWIFQTDYAGAGSPPPPAAEAGQIIRVAGGYGIITSVEGNTLFANMLVQPTGLLPNTPGFQIIPSQPAGTWSLSDNVTVVGGLDQFEGCVVGIVADGNVQAPQVVTQGCITLSQPASYVLAGALYSCQAQTLPASNANEPTDQGRRKDQAAVTLRCVDTRGIYVGPDWDDLVPQKERTDEPFFLATQFTRTGSWQDYTYSYAPLTPEPPEYDDIRTVLAEIQSEASQICVQQTYPMPCTLLAEVPEIAMGDTPSP